MRLVGIKKWQITSRQCRCEYFCLWLLRSVFLCACLWAVCVCERQGFMCLSVWHHLKTSIQNEMYSIRKKNNLMSLESAIWVRPLLTKQLFWHIQLSVISKYWLMNYRQKNYTKKDIWHFGIKASISFVVCAYKYRSVCVSDCVNAAIGGVLTSLVVAAVSLQTVYETQADLRPSLMREVISTL